MFKTASYYYYFLLFLISIYIYRTVSNFVNITYLIMTVVSRCSVNESSTYHTLYNAYDTAMQIFCGKRSRMILSLKLKPLYLRVCVSMLS